MALSGLGATKRAVEAVTNAAQHVLERNPLTSQTIEYLPPADQAARERAARSIGVVSFMGFTLRTNTLVVVRARNNAWLAEAIVKSGRFADMTPTYAALLDMRARNQAEPYAPAIAVGYTSLESLIVDDPALAKLCGADVQVPQEYSTEE